MFINIGSNRTILFIRQLTGPIIPTFPGIPVDATPPPLPYPKDNIFVGLNEGLGTDFATEYISSIAYNIPPEKIKAFDFKGTIDAAEGLKNINISQSADLSNKSIEKINAALSNLTIIDGQGYILPDGSSYVVKLINIENFNEDDIKDVLDKIQLQPKKSVDKISPNDIKSFLDDFLENE